MPYYYWDDVKLWTDTVVGISGFKLVQAGSEFYFYFFIFSLTIK